MRGPAGGAAAKATSATRASALVATPRRRHGGPGATQVTSRRNVSPGRTGRRKRAFSTATSRRSVSSATRAPSCTSASQSTTPGSTGAPGKWPAKYGSLALTRLVPTARTPGSTSRTYGNAGALAPGSGSRSRGMAILLLVLALPTAAAAASVLVWRRVVQLHDLVGDVDRLVVVEERAARRLEHERVAVLGAVVALD